MSYFEHKELEYVKILIENGKFREANQILDDFREIKDISHDEQIFYYILMSSLFAKLGKKEELVNYAEKAYQASKGLKKSIQLLDVYIRRALAYIWEFKYEEGFKLILQSEKLYNTLNQEPSSELMKRKADIAWLKSISYMNKGHLDTALNYAEQALALRKKQNLKVEVIQSLSTIKEIYYLKGNMDLALKYTERCLRHAEEIDYKSEIQFCYVSFGLVCALKGELEKSIKYYKQALAIAEEIGYEHGIAACLNNLGLSYQQLGDFIRAQECLEKSLGFFNKAGELGFTSIDSLFHLALDKGDSEGAQKYLAHLEQLNDQHGSKFLNLVYRIDKAIFLKTSPRAINRGKAEEMLKQIAEDEIFNYDMVLTALLHLCHLLLNELQNTSDLVIIDELKPYIIMLLDVAEKNHSYLLQAEVYILQARLSLVSFELIKARRFLTKAQSIAEKYHLNRLAIKISSEHDKLLKQLNIWEEIKESKGSLSERMRLARLSEQMDTILHKRALEPLEIPDEDPVVILILAESGEPIFSYLFDEKWNFEDHLIGGFLTAINSFSDEMFAQGLDRATFGQYNLFMKSISPFLVCYLYKGPSYLARQRIKLFLEYIQKDKGIWETFNKFLITSQLVQLKDVPSIKPLINDIFIEKNIQLDVFESKSS